MRKINIGIASALIMLGAVTNTRASDEKIAVVAAENFYGDVAQQIGGDEVSVTSILSNPDQDPHLFETSPSAVRDVTADDLKTAFELASITKAGVGSSDMES